MNVRRALDRPRLWAWAWTAGAAALLLARVPPPVEDLAGLPSLDKLAHVALFWAVARAWLGALRDRIDRTASGWGVVAVVVAVAVYGGLLELAQTLGQARQGDALDALADALGAALAPLGRRRRERAAGPRGEGPL